MRCQRQKGFKFTLYAWERCGEENVRYSIPVSESTANITCKYLIRMVIFRENYALWILCLLCYITAASSLAVVLTIVLSTAEERSGQNKHIKIAKERQREIPRSHTTHTYHTNENTIQNVDKITTNKYILGVLYVMNIIPLDGINI